MNDLSSLAVPVVRELTPEQKHGFESAGAFVNQIALALQFWLDNNGVVNDKRWVLSAGETIEVHSLAASGHSMLQLEGQRTDGTLCLLMAHQHSVQLLAYYVPRKKEEPPKREIGFHTGTQEIKIPQ